MGLGTARSGTKELLSYVGYGFLSLYDQISEDTQCPAWHIFLMANKISSLTPPHHQLDRLESRKTSR